MKREDKVISLDLAKQIDVEHKRLGIEVEVDVVSEWWWWDGTGEEHELIQDDSLAYRDRQELDIHGYPAYDCAELGEMLPETWKASIYPSAYYIKRVGDNCERTEANARGKYYLWLLKEGYITKVMGEKEE